MKQHYQLNQYIKADKLRVIGPDEKQIGVLSHEKALFKAKQLGLDLIVVAEKAQPPVAKIIDFSKFKYQQQQKIKESKKKDKSHDIKEVRFTPFIAQNDFATRIKRLQEFLNQGHKVKLTVKFTGRQITRKEFGYQLLKKAVSQLAQFATQLEEPKLQGKLLWTTMASLPKKKQKNEKKQKN